MSVMPFIFQNESEYRAPQSNAEEVTDKAHVPHAPGLRGAQFDAQFNRMCRKTNDCISLLVSAWPHLLIGRSQVMLFVVC